MSEDNCTSEKKKGSQHLKEKLTVVKSLSGRIIKKPKFQDESSDDEIDEPCSSKSLLPKVSSAISHPSTSTATPMRTLDMSCPNQLKEFLKPVSGDDGPQEGTSTDFKDDGEEVSPAQRRTSSRNPKPPVRFRDDDQEEGPRRVSERATRPKVGLKEFDENSTSTIAQSIESNSVAEVSSAPIDDEDAPLSSRKSASSSPMKRKLPSKLTVEDDDSEDEPLVKRAASGKKKIDNSTNSSFSSCGSSSVRNSRAQINYSEEESEEDDKPLRRTARPRRSIARQESSDEISPSKSRRSAGRRGSVKSSQKRRYAESEDESESEDDADETDEEISASQVRSYRDTQKSSTSQRPKRSRVCLDPELSEDDDLPRKSRLGNKNVRVSHRARQNVQKDDVRKSRRTARKNYNEDESASSSSGRENRHPSRKRRKTKPEYSSDDDVEDDEDRILRRKKTTVTSRGRICKPNPRII